MLLTCAAVSEAILTSGFSTFMPKFIENEYGQTAGVAAMIGGEIYGIAMFLLKTHTVTLNAKGSHSVAFMG